MPSPAASFPFPQSIEDPFSPVNQSGRFPRAKKSAPTPKVPENPNAVHIEGIDEALGEMVPRALPPPVQRRGFKIGVAVAAIVFLILLGAGGKVAWDAFFGGKSGTSATATPAPAPAAKQAPSTPAAAVGKAEKVAPPAAGVATQIAEAPKNAIDKAQSALAAKRKIEQDRIDAIAAGEDAPVKRLFSPLPSNQAETARPPAQAGAFPAPPPPPGQRKAASVVDGASVPASAEFRRVVSEFMIRSVFQGTPPKAMINGILYRAGDIVEREMGIVFVGIDTDRKLIIFRDPAGAIVVRRYI